MDAPPEATACSSSGSRSLGRRLMMAERAARAATKACVGREHRRRRQLMRRRRRRAWRQRRWKRRRCSMLLMRRRRMAWRSDGSAGFASRLCTAASESKRMGLWRRHHLGKLSTCPQGSLQSQGRSHSFAAESSCQRRASRQRHQQRHRHRHRHWRRYPRRRREWRREALQDCGGTRHCFSCFARLWKGRPR